MWAYRYYYGYRGKSDSPHRMGGSLIHTCYQYHFANIMPPEKRPEWFYRENLVTALKRQAMGIDEPARTDLVTMALENFAAFRSWYPDDAKLFEPISIEDEFAATLGELDPGGPWPELDNDVVTFRGDLIIAARLNGDITLVDYKTLGSSKVHPKTRRLLRWNPTSEYGLHWQTLMNLHILRKHYGARVRHVAVQRTTRQIPYDFDRPLLLIPDQAYAETPRVMRELVKMEYDVIGKILAGGKPSPRFHACFHRYGDCDYKIACMEASEAQHILTLEKYFTKPSPAESAAARRRLRILPEGAEADVMPAPPPMLPFTVRADGTRVWNVAHLAGAPVPGVAPGGASNDEEDEHIPFLVRSR